MIVLHESQLLGNTILYSIYLSANNIFIEKKEHYQKRSSRNRYDILTSQGIKTLSIPLSKGKNQQMPITEVKISYDENWIKNHLETIRSSYGKSPFFEFYFPEAENIFKKRYTFLYDLNMNLLVSMLKALKINADIQETVTYKSDYPDHNDIIDYRQQAYNATKHITPFLSAYPQVWQSHTGFAPSLSVLDLLMCLGPEARTYLSDIHPIVMQKLSDIHPSLQPLQA